MESNEPKPLACPKCNNKAFTILGTTAVCSKCGTETGVPESDELERVRVQLAGCSVAANGGTKHPHLVQEGAYGWSPSYQDVLDLRLQHDKVLANIASALKACQDEETFKLLNSLLPK